MKITHIRKAYEIAYHGIIKVQIKLLELTRGKFSVAYNRPSEAGMNLAAKVENAEIKLLVDTEDQIKESCDDHWRRIKPRDNDS